MSGHGNVRAGLTWPWMAMVVVVAVAAQTAWSQEQIPQAASSPAPVVQPAEVTAAAATPVAAAVATPMAVAASQPASQPAPAAAISIEAASPIQVSKPGTFEIHVQGADLKGVLQLLSTQGRKNIVATKEVTGTVTADLYGVTFNEALEAILRSAGFVYVEKGNFIYVYTPKQMAEAAKVEQQMETRVFRLAYVPAADAKPLVEAALSPDGLVSLTPAAQTGVETSDTETGGDSYALNDVLVVTDYPPFLSNAAQIIDELDSRPEQVLIEVTMLDAKLEDSNALGVNFSTLCGVDWHTLENGGNVLGDVDPPGMGVKDGPITDESRTNVRTDFTTVSNGFTFGMITNNLAMFITALESITDTTVLANPKLLVLNKQRGEVLVGSRDGYLVTTVTEGQTTQSVQFLETGTRLVVRPYIGRDGFIRLEIHPEDSQGTVTVTEGLALPTESTTELTTNLMVRDGHTIVMGGLFREETKTSRNQIPGLGSIPVLGTLFRYNKDSTDRKEIIILMTPHIIRHERDEAVAEQMKEDVERFRLGHRKGLRWWGRERLAQVNMRWAKRFLAEDKPDLALWNIDLALSMEPRLVEAIDLKEQITDKAVWADEAASSPAQYMVERMIMHELGVPAEQILPPAKPRSTSMIDPQVRESLGMEVIERMPLDEYLAPAVAPAARNGVYTEDDSDALAPDAAGCENLVEVADPAAMDTPAEVNVEIAADVPAPAVETATDELAAQPKADVAQAEESIEAQNQPVEQ